MKNKNVVIILLITIATILLIGLVVVPAYKNYKLKKAVESVFGTPQENLEDSKIEETLSMIRLRTELEWSDKTFYKGVCEKSDIVGFLNYIKNSEPVCSVSDDGLLFRAYAKLNNGYYSCVDSEGNSGEVSYVLESENTCTL